MSLYSVPTLAVTIVAACSQGGGLPEGPLLFKTSAPVHVSSSYTKVHLRSATRKRVGKMAKDLLILSFTKARDV